MITIDEIKENFSNLGADDKYTYLLELGNFLPMFPKEYETDENLVKGCASKVYISMIKKNDRAFWFFDSDSIIIKGMLYIFYLVLNDKKIEEIKSINFNDLIKGLGLNDLLTTSRQNGLNSIINSINNKLF